MTRTRHTLEEIQETAALYALGALEPNEKAEFEAHLAQGCALCQRELEASQRTALHLADSVSALPSAGLRDRVLAIPRGESAAVGEPVIEHSGVRFVHADAMDWQDLSDTISVKHLSIDPQRGQVTQLIRMAPGAKLNAHRHVGPEQSFILDGELIVDGVRMQAGDYCLARPDSVHDEVRTDIGCTFLAVSSLQDEYRD